MSKTHQKLVFKKIVKLTDHNSAYNSLTHFEYDVNVKTENGNNVNLLKLAQKILEITSADPLWLKPCKNLHQIDPNLQDFTIQGFTSSEKLHNGQTKGHIGNIFSSNYV